MLNHSLCNSRPVALLGVLVCPNFRNGFPHHNYCVVALIFQDLINVVIEVVSLFICLKDLKLVFFNSYINHTTSYFIH